MAWKGEGAAFVDQKLQIWLLVPLALFIPLVQKAVPHSQIAHLKRDVGAALKFDQRTRNTCRPQTRTQQCDPTSPSSFNL